MTWDHPRGYDPMVATAAAYAQRHPGVHINWEKRSLQAFADFPVEQLAQRYDLIVIDHPHAGFVAREGCLVALEGMGHEAELADLARHSLGGSHESYQYDGHQWALAIDAATQVASYREDLLDRLPRTWSEVIALAREGRVLWPIKPVDALMSFFTATANRGTPCRTDGRGELIALDHAEAALEQLLQLALLVAPDCLAMNPIQAYERLAAADNRQLAYCPLGYGYTNYARPGFRPHRLKFADIPEFVAGAGPRGSAIGGTGIAVSSLCRHRDVAADYAFWIAGGECQRGLYFDSGGQPGHAAAWDDDHCNAQAGDFFRNTRQTLDRVYLRPRFSGYLRFQDEGGDLVNACLAGRATPRDTAQRLRDLYHECAPR
jgi:multiple sugar transport system substrate-binding protein